MTTSLSFKLWSIEASAQGRGVAVLAAILGVLIWRVWGADWRSGLARLVQAYLAKR